jgi:quinoprotein glucose dehydrogenase
MEQWPMRFWTYLCCFGYLITAALVAEELPLLFHDDFSDGIGAWEPTDPAAWQITDVSGNAAFEILGGSKYDPPHRSPVNIALRREPVVGDFVLTARVRTKREEAVAHRDMCLVFGYQDPANFYYVHLGQKTDPHANQIFLVKGADRVAISEIASEGTPWEFDRWHEVKVVRSIVDGLIEIYFDDMEKPSHVAHDLSFREGRVGIGTFDDMGLWDDIKLRGTLVEHSATAERTADPHQLKFTRWTPDFQVPDPVAISFDPQGRAYVTQTQRRKANDLDIRENVDWIPDDLRFQSIEEKEAFYREQFVPSNSVANAKRVADLNGDGSHDITDLTALSERIHLISDTDGDGLADSIQTYAEQLDHLLGGVAGGVLYREGAVYTCPVPEVVRFRDTDGDDKADEREVIASGFGVHLSYAGHDMHGLFTGPDGRIYWSIGDKGIRVKTADGYDYRFPYQGGLMRCEPDGSNFEVFAHGQRNIQEVTFDHYGNFFGVDNDADYEGERERFVQVEQYMDSGWRFHWQYLKNDYNPWTDEPMHLPYAEGQARWFTPPISNYENGPAGFKQNPGTALGGDYGDYFFLTSAPKGDQWAFRVQRNDDHFVMVHDHKIGEGIPLVGLQFSPDGGLYGVDWGGGYPMNQKGAVWRIDVDAKLAHPLREQTRELLGGDWSKRNIDELSTLLGYADQRVRLEAQFELARRFAAEPFLAVATDLTAPPFARIHAIWGLGQLLRGEAAGQNDLLPLLKDPDPEIRVQTLKVLTDRFGRSLGLDVIPAPSAAENILTSSLVPLLNDPVIAVRMQALLALARLRDAAASEAIITTLAHTSSKVSSTYLRHAGTMALTGCVSSDRLAALAEHKSDFVRTCASLALGRRGDPAIAAFLSDPDPVIAGDAAHYIHDDFMIADAMPALTAALEKHPSHEPLARRAISAHFYLGAAENAAALVSYVAKGQAPTPMLEAGLEALEHWTNPKTLDLVTGSHRPLAARDPAILSAALLPHLDDLLTAPLPAVRSTTMTLARQAGLPINNETLGQVLAQTDADAHLRAEALRTLASQDAPNLLALIQKCLDDSSREVRIAALDLLTERDATASLLEIEKRLASSKDILLTQHAIRCLPEVGGSVHLQKLLTQWERNTLAASLQLDVYEAANRLILAGDEALKGQMETLQANWQAAVTSNPFAAFAMTLEGGDPAKGRSLFLNHPVGQCVACHKIAKGSGSEVGPNLVDVGKRQKRPYLLESLIAPQASVVKGYGIVSVTLKDGSTVSGQFLSEDKKGLTIRNPEGAEQVIKNESIKERGPTISTMPPMEFLLSKSEIRDLVAFLASLQGEPVKPAAEH